MNKTVLYGKDSRAAIQSGVDKIVKAVACTMGAAGKNVLIGGAVYHEGWLIPTPIRVSKDGFTVARHFDLIDPIEQRGAMMIKEAATKTVEEAGDATTCTCVLAGSLISDGIKKINAGANSQQIKKGMDAALVHVLGSLTKMSIPVKGDKNRIKQIATVSANNDAEIGELISDTFDKIGEDGIIDIEASKGLTTEIKITDGYQLNRGWLSPWFVNNRAKETCEFENPLILLYQNKINHHTQVDMALDIAVREQRPLLLICDDCIDEALAYLSMNTQNKSIVACAIKSPFGEYKNEEMEDIALLTGGVYLSDLKGIDIAKEMELSFFGQAKKAIVSKNETVIISGAKDEVKFEELIADLRMNLTQMVTEDEKFPTEARIARLKGSTAVIKVGAATETEMNEKMDRVDDAVRATKAAIREGGLAGGGTAFLRVENSIQTTTNSDFNAGIEIVFSALEMPLKQICENAGIDDPEILKNVKSEKGNMGYNVLSGKIEDMAEAGIIDSTKALKSALTNAVSVAGMILTSECSIITQS